MERSLGALSLEAVEPQAEQVDACNACYAELRSRLRRDPNDTTSKWQIVPGFTAREKEDTFFWCGSHYGTEGERIKAMAERYLRKTWDLIERKNRPSESNLGSIAEGEEGPESLGYTSSSLWSPIKSLGQLYQSMIAHSSRTAGMKYVVSEPLDEAFIHWVAPHASREETRIVSTTVDLYEVYRDDSFLRARSRRMPVYQLISHPPRIIRDSVSAVSP